MSQSTICRRGNAPDPWRGLARFWLFLVLLASSVVPAFANGDFRLQMFDNPSPVDRGSDLTFQANVSRIDLGNQDHNIPAGQTLTFTLPGNLSFVSVSPSSAFDCGSPAVGGTGIVVTCQVVTPIYGTFETVTLVTNTTNDAALTRTMTATLSNPDDQNPSDNIATTTTPVTEPRTPTTTTTTSSSQPSLFGQSVTFTSTVTGVGATPTGLFAFFIDGDPGTPVPLDGNGQATFTTATLTIGTHTVCGYYLGDSNNLPSCGTLAGDQVVNPVQTGPGVTGTIIIREVTDAPDGSYGFTSPTAALNISVSTLSGTGQSAGIAVAAGTHLITAADTRDTGVALTGLVCSDSDSTGDVATRTATVALEAGESVTCTFTSTDSRKRTTDLIEDFLATRADLILSNQPDTDSRIDRLNGTPSTTGNPVSALLGYVPGLAAGSPLTVSTSLNALSRMTGEGDPANPFDIWFKGTYASLDSDAGNGKFGLATFGADYVFNRDLLIGAIVQIDRLSLAQPGSAISGTGWLAGPYVTARLAPSLFLDVVAAAGTSSNSVSPFATYRDSFDTTRWMVQATVKGDWTHDAWSFSPGARLGYFSEGAQAYTDSLGVAIPDISAGLGQFAVSPEIGYRIETDGDLTIDTRLKLEGIVSFARGGAESGLGDTHGRVEAGVDVTTRGGMRFGFAAAYDGIGSSDLSAVGATARISLPLN